MDWANGTCSKYKISRGFVPLSQSVLTLFAASFQPYFFFHVYIFSWSFRMQIHLSSQAFLVELTRIHLSFTKLASSALELLMQD